jgi:hypothetical protein
MFGGNEMTDLCQYCNLPHGNLPDCLARAQRAIADLLTLTAEPGRCRHCGMDIFWVRHLNGKAVPYTLYGLNHFIDCTKVPRRAAPARPVKSDPPPPQGDMFS